MKYWKVSAVLAIVMLSITAIAATPTWHNSKIRTIYPLADGRVVLTLENDSAACQNNSSPKYYYIAVGENGVTQEGLNNMLSVALTAATTGREISFNFDADSSGCQINRLSLNFQSQ
ncbi:response regulator receiver protein [Porticoccus sp. W117]|uniref:response regulator receiver protein n=1 Tax=Porticoccus sp. W117 TaxID=3054777 RepID=UPI002594D0CC|nr:response regulator receiver protein [Porticoccus sp. W117]MDM3869726.1 response regulator receiver protein [Porticoccus sp. W117]